jgi:hypothetical protein
VLFGDQPERLSPTDQRREAPPERGHLLRRLHQAGLARDRRQQIPQRENHREQQRRRVAQVRQELSRPPGRDQSDGFRSQLRHFIPVPGASCGSLQDAAEHQLAQTRRFYAVFRGILTILFILYEL